jgi:acyl transferase domain-containing protein/thioesterase domain-containing protein
MTDTNANTNGSEIAIVGMAGRFPGAKNITEFWDKLQNGIESISLFSDQELAELNVAPELLANPDYVRVKGGLLEDKEMFDPAFFGYSPKEAEIMNPQTRVFHECAWHAIEDAGYNPESYDGIVGLYAGGASSLYWESLTMLSGKSEDLGSFAARYLNNKDFLTTQIAYKLNLKGPVLSVQTACSTSLVAIHLACQGILNGECDMALAGGICITTLKERGYLYQEGMVTSPDGHCRAFDAKGKGFIGGEGSGVVLLKLLEDALSDADHIYAVIKGAAINNDGLRKVGFTAPSIEGQVEAIRTAHLMAEVEPDTIGYIEAHGTATTMGDPVEVEALKLAFNTEKKNFCGIGSVKTNIGHLDTAAGIAGFIKTVLALNHQQIPPSLNFETPNPRIDFKNSPFFVNNKLSDWKTNGNPRRAGVSSFGIGGTNAHVVLEEWQGNYLQENSNSNENTNQRDYCIIPLSAKTPTALDRATENLGQYLKENKDIPLDDAAYTLAVGRKKMACKRMAVCKDVNNIIEMLADPDSRTVHTHHSKLEGRPVIFMFAGLGSQYVNMGRELYDKEAIFRDEMNRCFDILKPLTAYDIKEILYPRQEDEANASRIREFEIGQLVIFCFEYALARLIMNWGVTPEAMIGYSFGEYVAAAISGVFSLEDALKLIVSRGKLIETRPHAAMMSIPMPKEELEPLLGESLSIAIDNGTTCIAAGSAEDIKALEEKLKAKKCMCFPMNASHAIHTKMMTPILPEFEKNAAAITFHKPQIPYLSNLTGKWQNPDDVAGPSYWARHMAETVLFDDGIKEMQKKENAVFIEIGPGRDISAMVGRDLDKSAGHKLLNLVRPAEQDTSDLYYLLNKIGQLWLFGLRIDWQAFYQNQNRRRLSLPGYSFEKQYYWIEEDVMNNAIFQPADDIADWSYLPLWKRASLVTPKEKKASPVSWLVFVNDATPVNSLVKKLMDNRQHVTIVKAGNSFEQTVNNGAPVFTINPRVAANYDVLFEKLGAMEKLPENIIHCWNITAGTETLLNRESFDNTQYFGFYSMMYLAKAIEKLKTDIHTQIFYLANGTQDVTGMELLCPEKTPVLGLIKSIPQELSTITCRSIDIVLPEPGSPGEASLTDLLLDECSSVSQDVSIAYRDNQRWVQFFDTHHLPVPVKPLTESCLKKQGVYLITGGLGTIGLILARLLVGHVQARLIFTGRSVFPDRAEWDQWPDSHDEDDPTSLKIIQLQKLREMGGDVLYIQADVADLEQMRHVMARAESTFGKINGVIHAAGIMEGDSMSLIDQLSDSDCQLQFHPKVYGTLVVEELFKSQNLDFCWLLSSISCVLGGLGFGAYAAANSFMDMFIRKHNRTSSNANAWFSLNWDGMDEAKSAVLFERIFHLQELDQMVVSLNGKLQDRIDRWVKLETLHEDGATGEKTSDDDLNFKTRPQLMNPFVPASNRTEKDLTEIWQRLLGYDGIGIDDNFTELGGDSLASINLTAQIKKSGSHVALTDVLANPTIRQLAAQITEKNKAEELMAEVYEDRLLSTLDCIEKLNKTHNKPKIFIVHPQHGMLNQYKELGQELAADYSAYGVQARGVLPGSKMAESAYEMLDVYVEQILKVQSEGPFIFVGYCTGLRISYEIIRRLESMGHTVERMVNIDGSSILTAQYVKILKAFEYLPKFAKKIFHRVNKKRFKKAKLNKERYDNENNVYESDVVPHMPGVSKRLYDYIYFIATFIFPLEIIKAPIVVARAEKSEYNHYTLEHYIRTTRSNAVIKITPGDHDSLFERPNVETLAEIIRSK